MFLIQGLRDMGEQLGLEELAYIRWMCIHEPSLFKTTAGPLPVDLVKQMIGVDKPEFFYACELLWSQGTLRDFLQSR
jgi:hypothetical protein